MNQKDSVFVVAKWVQGEAEPASALLLKWRKDSPDLFAKNVAELMETMLELAGPDVVESFGRSLLAAQALSASDWQICLTRLRGQNLAVVLAQACLEAQITPDEAYRALVSHLLALGLADQAALLVASALAVSGIAPSALKPVWSDLAHDDPAHNALIAELTLFYPPDTQEACYRLVDHLGALGVPYTANADLVQSLVESFPGDEFLLDTLASYEAPPYHRSSPLTAALERIADAGSDAAAMCLARKLMVSGDYEAAVIRLRSALTRHPENGGLLWFSLGYALGIGHSSEESDVQRAIEAYEQALLFVEGADNPSAAELLWRTNLNLALLYCYVGQGEKSRAALSRLPADTPVGHWPRSSPQLAAFFAPASVTV